MIKIKRELHFSYVALFALLSGCVNVQYSRPLPGQSSGAPRSGIYHTVQKGQTLWRISRLYNIDLAELISVNNISDAVSMEIGQQIFIPQTYARSSQDSGVSFEDFIWPLKGRLITRFQEIRDNMINKGIDIRPESGSEVLASRSGKVVFLHNNFNGFGKTIIVEHFDGFLTVYTGFNEVFIKLGDNVRKGQAIAKMGFSGSQNNFLHFEIRKGHTPQNPVFYLSS